MMRLGFQCATLFDILRFRTNCVARHTRKSLCASAAFGITNAALPEAAYVHLPFCRQRCHYCAFPVVVPSSSRDEASAAAEESRYIDCLEAEIRAASRSTSAHIPLTSIYFGGGTPSLTSPDGLRRIMALLRDEFGIADECEVTCEMDPATFDANKAAEFRAIGVNRASVGAQAFDDKLLSSCGRLHSVSDIYGAVSVLRSVGVENISLDLISGLPHQTSHQWEHSLNALLSLATEHVSIYDLTIEANTKFGRLFSDGGAPLPSEATSAEMLQTASERLRGAGYTHYEVSNYARNAKSLSRHNLAYWRGNLFWGFGLGATSLTPLPAGNVIRHTRPKGMSSYSKYARALKTLVGNNASIEKLVAAIYPCSEPCTTDEILEDKLINGFRLLLEGIDLRQIGREHGERVTESLIEGFHRTEFGTTGLMELVHDHENALRLRLTEKGALFENSIVSCLFVESIWKIDRKTTNLVKFG